MSGLRTERAYYRTKYSLGVKPAQISTYDYKEKNKKKKKNNNNNSE